MKKIFTLLALLVAKVELYNLQGIRITNPQEGQFYIKRQGNKVSKLIF
ncbi:MAG: hypothetical protein MR030_03440 [Bacteroidales bacterium]|nr:hypothetical protein [Bacteroidales bacterium]